MVRIDQREALARICRERREDYANLSRVIGRNPTYIQQFISKGSPKRLAEKDVRTLARYLRVPVAELGGIEDSGTVDSTSGLVLISMFEVDASAGPGMLDGTETAMARIGFEPKWLRQLSPASPKDLSIIRVQGDSMFPTLADGDDIMVDRSSASGRLHDGIYVLRRDDALLVKRLAINPASRRVTITSDNPAYPSWPDCDISELGIVGRVVWAGRKIG